MPLLNTDSPAIRERYSVFLLAQNRLLREALTVRCTPRVDRQLAALCAICGNYRGKTLVQEIDIYDLLLNGIHTEMARIESGDTILIPPVGPQMTVQGMVRRPAIYELGGETSLAE
ncbi:MAG: polysaccharide export protein, partial [Acidobacteriaceae bacterium]|nr:polysaccharide export protein [Acidobacteriaceae bacterium]